MLRRACFLLLFLVSFFATAVWIRGLVPERLKIEWFETVEDQADVVFLGSSHVFRQFDPALFDTLRGAPADGPRSYNLGTLGMELPEEAYLLRRLLDAPPPALRWVVIEAQPLNLAMRNENDFGTRRIGWHDSATTWMLVRALYASELPWAERKVLLRRHVEHWWRRSVNLARGMDVVESLGRDPMARFEDLSALGARNDGYEPLDPATASQRNRSMRRAFLQDPSELLAAREALPAAGDGGAPDPALRDLVRTLEAEASTKGIGLVWWLHPNLERHAGWRRMAEEGDLQHLLAYDDPERYPELYRVERRFDRFHLDRRGAEWLTEDFTREFLRIAEASGP